MKIDQVIATALAVAHLQAANEDTSSLLTDGRLLVSEQVFDELMELTSKPIPEQRVDALFGIPVEAIPDDGEPHDVGNGKVAIVSWLDHRSVIVMPIAILDYTVRVHHGDITGSGSV